MEKIKSIPLDQDTKFAELEKRFPLGVVRCMTKKGYAYFRVMTQLEFAKYMSKIVEDGERAAAQEEACASAVVHPERPVFHEWCDDYPGIAMTCINRVLELSGYDSSGKD